MAASGKPDSDHAPPAGFVRLPPPAGDQYTAYLGPLFARFEGEALVMGFRVGERHVNPIGIAHGGALMTFADVFMALASLVQGDLEAGFLPTVNLSGDFMAPTPVGAWVEGRTQLLRATRTLVFAQGLATADGTPVLRASGVFKVPHAPALSIHLGKALHALIEAGGIKD